jgi:adenine/guanine phosphoribosyltransferase-like PRPP-binding protein
MQDEPTRGRRNPPASERFPSELLLLAGLIVLVGVLAIVATVVTAGVGGLVIAALVAIFVGVPMAIRKARRPVDVRSEDDADDEDEREPVASADTTDMHAPPEPQTRKPGAAPPTWR